MVTIPGMGMKFNERTPRAADAADFKPTLDTSLIRYCATTFQVIDLFVIEVYYLTKMSLVNIPHST